MLFWGAGWCFALFWSCSALSPLHQPWDARGAHSLAQEKQEHRGLTTIPACSTHWSGGAWATPPTEQGDPCTSCSLRKVHMREEYVKKCFCMGSFFPWKLKYISVIFFSGRKKKSLSLSVSVVFCFFLSVSVSISVSLSHTHTSPQHTHTQHTCTHTQAESSLYWI